MTYIDARFVGPEPSLGYVPGERYELTVTGRVIRDVNGVGQPCPYGTIEAFLQNWTDIIYPDYVFV